MPRVLLICLLLAACATPPPPAPQPAPLPPTPAPSAPEPSIGTVTVAASALNVRREPSTSGEVITLVKRGERLTLLFSTESWMKVRLESGETGWVSSQHVMREGAVQKKVARKKSGCAPDSDYAFVTTPTPTFSDSGAHGLVVVEAGVDSSGKVLSTKVITNTTGDQALAFLTERELKGTRFAPPIRDCVARAFIFTYKRTF
jgi:uncharacterized protein YgiM (DUF1202 family)